MLKHLKRTGKDGMPFQNEMAFQNGSAGWM
jgi:hypothetical protein